jgi:hypothetical protein
VQQVHDPGGCSAPVAAMIAGPGMVTASVATPGPVVSDTHDERRVTPSQRNGN